MSKFILYSESSFWGPVEKRSFSHVYETESLKIRDFDSFS